MAEPWLEFQAPESEGPWSAFAPPAAKPPGLVGRLKQGLNSTLNYGRINLTDNPDEIAGYVADTERNRPAVTPAQQKMQEEIQPYAQQAKEAEGFVPNVAAYGKLAAKRAGQLVSNPSEFAGMVAENLPNSVPGIAAGLAGGAVGGMTPVPGGALIGGLVGGTAGGYQVEQGSSMHDQIVKEAQARGVPLTDEKALSAIIAEKYPEFLQASRLKGVGTAGTDAAINALTLGVAGAGERAIAKEAQGLAALAKTGGISATDYAAQVAALEAKNATRNTLGQKALRGTGVTLGEMGGESVSEGVGQQLAYGQLDPLDVVDEGLLAVGQGAATAGARKVISPILGIGEKGGAEAAIEQAKNTVPAPAIPDPSTGGTFTPDPNGGVLERGLSAMANARAEVDAGAARNIDTVDRGLDLVAPPTAPNTLQDSELPIVGQPAPEPVEPQSIVSGNEPSTTTRGAYGDALAKQQRGDLLTASDVTSLKFPPSDVEIQTEPSTTKKNQSIEPVTRRVDMALPPAVTQQQLADQEANRSTLRADVTENERLEGKRSVYQAIKNSGAPDDIAAAFVVKYQETANRRGEPMTLWESESGQLGIVPSTQSSPFVNGKRVGTLYPENKTQEQSTAEAVPSEKSPKSEQTPATPVAESKQAPAPKAGDGKVATAQGRAASEQLFTEDAPVFTDQPNQGTADAVSNQTAETVPQQAKQQAQTVADSGAGEVRANDPPGNATPAKGELDTGTPGSKPVPVARPASLPNHPAAKIVAKYLPEAKDVQIHSTDSLSSEKESGATGRMSKWRGKTIERMARVFGRKKVVFFSSANTTADGMNIGGGDTLYVNIDSGVDPIAVVGHEWRHALKTSNAAAHAAINQAATKLLDQPGRLLEFAKYYYGTELQQDAVKERIARIEAGEATAEDKAFLAEEFSADMTGNLWRDPKALKEVFDTIMEQHPPSAARTIIKSIGDAILKLIDKLIISTPKGQFSEMGISRDELLGLKKEIQAAMADSFKQDVQRRLDKVRAGQGGEVKFASARKPGSDIGHKRENESGRYVGAPDWVGNAVGQIAVLRNKLRGLAKDGEPGRFWYENSSKAILELVNGDKNEAEKLVQLIAIYSPSNAVPGNTTMAVKAYYQWKQGLPIRVGTGNNDSKANELLYEGKEWGGIKTNSFYQNLMQEIDPSKNDTGAATMDMWMALAFDYGMKVVDQGPKYRFMEREIQRLARELTWTPHQVQAAIWTGMKGRIDPIRGALTAAELDNGWHNTEVTAAWNAGEKAAFATRQAAYEKAKAAGKKVSPPVLKMAGIDTLNSDRKKDHYKLAHKMGMAYNLRQEDVKASKYDFSDAIKERTAQMSWEATPGASTGVLPGIHDAPMAQQQEYLAAQRAAFTDDKGNDIIGKEIGIAMAKSVQGFSGWQGVSSVGIQDGMVIPPNSQEGGLVQEVARNAIDLFAAVRGLVLAQEGVAWHYPIYTGSKNALNGVQFDIGRLLTEEESANLYKALSEELGHTFSPPIATQDGLGFRVLNFPDEKFALMDDFSDSADLLGQTGAQRKTKLQKSQLEKNKEFRDAVYRAVERQAWKELTVGNVSRFESDGNLVENDWSNGDGDYRERIREATEGFGARSWAGRSDIFEWIDRDLRPKAEAVNKEFADKYGWGKQQALFSPARSDAAGSPVARSGPGQADVGALPGSVSGTGVHYSKQQRSTLDSSFFGTGLKGDELPRVTEATDPRLKHRIYFYLNTGKGIKPEAGVGIHAHQADLSNIYDATNDTRDLVAKYAGKKNEFESALLDSGYDGYMTQSSGVAILLGERSQPVEYLGTNDRPDVDQAGTAEKSDFGKLQRSVVDNKSLPSGEMTGADWKRMMPKLMPEIDVSHLADDQKYYKDGLVKRPEVKRSTARAMPAWWNEPSTNAFAKGMTQGDVIQDALDRYVKSGALKKIGEQYEFYHATPNKTLTELRAGTLLEYNPEDAKFFARRDRGLGKRAVTAIRLQLYPEQLNPPSGTWFSLRDDTPIDGAAKFSPARAQTETPEFKKWFGDSKVVDAEGKPLVVYHSTNADWSEFDPMQTLSSFGFHAGTKEQAEAVRGTGGTKADVTAVRPSEGLNVMPVYLSLQNPLRMEDKGTWYSHQMIEDLAQKGIKDRSPLPENARDLAGYGASHMSVAWDRASEARKRWDLAVKTRMKAWRAEHPDAGREAYDDEARVTGRNYVRDLLAKNGYDGIVYDNKFEGKGDSYIAFEPTQIKSATGNNGQFNAKNPDIRFSPPRFFSQLATSIDQIPKKMETMPAAQWRMWLNGNAPKLGIKKDEIVWSGIDDYLEMRGKDKVTKAEVQQFLSENGTQVKDVMLGGPTEQQLFEKTLETNKALFDAIRNDGAQVEVNGKKLWDDELYPMLRDGKVSPDDLPSKYQTLARDWLDAMDARDNAAPRDPTKFGQYVVPGGENYRELLITLPEKKRVGELPKGYGVRENSDGSFSVYDKGLNDVVATRATRADALRAAERFLLEQGGVDTRSGAFRSSHFDPPNILAHLRMNERTDAQGDKVLFLEELQSDWGQKGKKDGFAVDLDTQGLDGLRARKAALVEKYGSIARLAAGSDEDNYEYSRISEQIDRFKRKSDGVPLAPFVTDTKSWVALGLKRAIMYAVQNGMSKVAWANGEQNAAHYDLTKQISSIRVERGGTETNPLYGLNARNNDGQMIISKSMPAGELEDHIGKELAERAIKETAGEKTEVKYSGLDLKVGGEGMKAFYDEIVPSVARDVLKKLGGGKVETVKLDGIPGGAREAGDVLDRQENPNFKMLEQQGFRISPSMAEKVQTEGVPLFSPARAQTETPEFLKWFGDSKVVDADGKPLVVYHGTTKSFDKFDRSRSTDQGMIYFTPDAQYASGYFDSRYKGVQGRMERGSNVMPVYLSIKNPASANDQAKVFAKAKGEYWKNKEYLRDELIKQGFDGLIRGEGQEVIAFYPTQIKSAIGNNGQFDVKNPDIRRSTARAQTETPEFKAWFKDSKVVDGEGKPLVVYHGTTADITEFDPSRTKLVDGIFLTPSTAGASTYAASHPDAREREGANVMPLYVSMQNPRILKAARYNLTNLEAAMSSGDNDGVIVKDFDGNIHVVIARSSNQIKSAIGNNSQFDPTNPDIRRSTPRGAIANQPINQSWQDPDNMDKWDTFVRTMADKMWDTKKVLAAIRAAGIAIKDTIDPYLQEVLYHGRAAKRVSDFADSELRPMLVEMGMRKIERQELEDYLWARHATERNAQIAKINPKMPDGGSGLTNQQAADILAGQTVTVGKTATDPGRDIKLTISKMPGYRSLAAKVDAITKETTDTLVRYGLETQDTVDSWRATYGKYVPLMRDMEADDNYAGAFNLGLGTGQGFSVRGSASKRALGSERGVIDILANVAMQRERAIVRGEKNRVAQSMYGLAITAPNPDFWLPLNPDANKDPAQVTAELVAFGLNPIDAANIANEPKQRYTDPNTGMVMERINPQLRSRGDVLAVRINGKDRYVMFSSNERAQKMVAGLKNLDVDQLGMVMQKMAVVTRWFAAINTQYNPVFGLTNGIRDLGTGMLNLTSTELKGQQAEVLKNAFSALRGVYADLRDHRAGRTPTSRWALEYEEFALEGGQTGYRDMFQTSRDRTEGLMQELKDATKGKTLLTFSEKRSPLFGWLSDYNTAIENAIRLSAYKAAKDKGMTKAQAASLAKNLTVNFNKKGLAATQLGAMYAFFNAAAQGTARIGQTLVKVDNGKFSLTGAGKKIVYGGMMAGVLQAAMFAAAGYDDEEPPQFIREKNFIIPMPNGKYLSIPYPLGFHVIPNIGRVSAEFALGGFKNPGKRLVDMFSMIMDGFNPIGGSSGGVSQMLSPTVTDPLVALSENKDWTGKSIYKEDFNSMHPTAGWTRKKDTASDLSRWMAYGINYLTGGGKYEIGLLSPTPDQLDFLIGQGTGGVGRESLKAWQFGSTVATGENMPMYKVPIAGRFVGETTGQASETSKFYNNLKRIGEHKAALDEMQKAHDLSAMIEYRKDNPDAALVKQADKASTDISDLKRRKRELLENGASPEQIRMMEEMITTRVRSYNERLSARG